MIKICKVCGHEALPEHMKQYHPILAEYNNVGAYETSRRQELQAQIKKTINFINVASFENPMNMGPENEKLEALKNELASLGEGGPGSGPHDGSKSKPSNIGEYEYDRNDNERRQILKDAKIDTGIYGTDLPEYSEMKGSDRDRLKKYLTGSFESIASEYDDAGFLYTDEFDRIIDPSTTPYYGIDGFGLSEDDQITLASGTGVSPLSDSNTETKFNALSDDEKADIIGSTAFFGKDATYNLLYDEEKEKVRKYFGESIEYNGDNQEDVDVAQKNSTRMKNELDKTEGDTDELNIHQGFDYQERGESKEATDLFDDDEAEDHEDEDETDNLFESVAKEFNIGTDMTCPICNKEIDVGNTGEDTQGLDYNNVNVAWDTAGTYPVGSKMQDHFEQEHKPSDFGIGEAWEDWKTGNQLSQAFHDSYPEFNQDDVHLMNIDTTPKAGVTTYNDQGHKRFDDFGNTKCPNCGADELFDKSGHGNWGKSVYCQSCGWEGNVDDTKYGESKASEGGLIGEVGVWWDSMSPNERLDTASRYSNYLSNDIANMTYAEIEKEVELDTRSSPSMFNDAAIEEIDQLYLKAITQNQTGTEPSKSDFEDDVILTTMYESKTNETWADDLKQSIIDRDADEDGKKSTENHEYTCGICGDKFGDEAEYTDHKIAHDMDGT